MICMDMNKSILQRNKLREMSYQYVMVKALHLAAKMELGGLANGSLDMNQLAATLATRYFELYQFLEYKCIVDIGGGDGYFLAECLKRNPCKQGTLLDQPSVVEQAEQVM